MSITLQEAQLCLNNHIISFNPYNNTGPSGLVIPIFPLRKPRRDEVSNLLKIREKWVEYEQPLNRTIKNLKGSEKAIFKATNLSFMGECYQIFEVHLYT